MSTRPTWQDDLAAQLDAVTARPEGGTVELDVRTRQVSIPVREGDRFGCAIGGVTVRSRPDAGATMPSGNATAASHPSSPPVKQVAERIAKAVTYLGDPLAVSEVDDGGQKAIVRSERVRSVEGGGRYEQVTVTPTEIQLTGRAVTAPDAPATPAPLVVTRDTLRRVVDDLVSSTDR